ncbi:hypothetical protein [Actinoplanes sp. NPDC051851]|uniref:sulfotransferase-like domain-containing protein n=1 Tax=Actinoplanes sp. NPDC051851 TaxID=3154753 RepID=UPI00342A7000
MRSSRTESRTEQHGAYVHGGDDPILVILSPPRAASTALARAFWQHPRFRWYLHEPFDRAYHRQDGDVAPIDWSAGRIDLGELTGTARGPGLVVKEMTFQVGDRLDELVSRATLPVVVTLREPRLSIASRIRRRVLDGEPGCFPAAETGWPDLLAALRHMTDAKIPYVVVDVARLRSCPAATVEALCGHLGLRYEPTMLTWPDASHLRLGQLGDEQRRWYAAALGSRGFVASDETPPPDDWFPVELREVVRNCSDAYREILSTMDVVGNGDD